MLTKWVGMPVRVGTLVTSAIMRRADVDVEDQHHSIVSIAPRPLSPPQHHQQQRSEQVKSMTMHVHSLPLESTPSALSRVGFFSFLFVTRVRAHTHAHAHSRRLCPPFITFQPTSPTPLSPATHGRRHRHSTAPGRGGMSRGGEGRGRVAVALNVRQRSA